MIDYFSTIFIEHYQLIWSSSSHAERLIMFHLAHGRLLSLARAHAVRTLVRRGLMTLDPKPRLFNRSFAQFVRNVEKPETLQRWRDAVPAAAWSRAQVPILLMLGRRTGRAGGVDPRFGRFGRRAGTDARHGGAGAAAGAGRRAPPAGELTVGGLRAVWIGTDRSNEEAVSMKRIDRAKLTEQDEMSCQYKGLAHEILDRPKDEPVTITESSVRLDGVTLNVARAGPQDGPPIILLHGFPEFWWGWRHQIEPLAAAGFNVIAPDQRGYGKSDAPAGVDAYQLDMMVADVIALADALHVDQFHLVGHDWGGVIAWAVAARHPIG